MTSIFLVSVGTKIKQRSRLHRTSQRRKNDSFIRTFNFNSWNDNKRRNNKHEYKLFFSIASHFVSKRNNLNLQQIRRFEKEMRYDVEENKIINLKHEKIKRDTSDKTAYFYNQMETVYELMKQGKIKDIFIIIETKDGTKTISGNGITIGRGRQMARDFLNNMKDYID